ncbi:sensor histidine kinase, partial [Blautia pseudococcoides]|nr:sensor histidine kinase [Blautia pseudococcoides]
MLLLIVVLIILLIIMLLTLLYYRREIVRLTRQLDVIEDGSQIELSASVRSKEFIALYQKLETLLQTFRTSRFQYEKSQKQLKKTISNIAHDIRTPLTSAAGYLQMLEECRDIDTQKRYISIVQSRLDELKE